MDMVFDTATGDLSIDVGQALPWGAQLRAVLVRHGNTIDLRGVEMRLTITADGVEVFDLSLPPEGVRYRETDQDILATDRVLWAPDQAIQVSAWCRTSSGLEVTAQASFIAPRPAQPYPSWAWGAGAWQAPVPMPDAGDWIWDEGAGAWIEDSTP